ncbi:MAG: AraC family transcriptional regulator [Blautia sp.]|nr:AraC family transcriptional regulator [Blautia sp.]
MHDPERNENRLRGTYEFPYEFHDIDSDHPRYVMSYHWHVEFEIIRILTGSFVVTLDEKTYRAQAGDVIFIHSGVLHSGIPEDNCTYQCIVFDLNSLLRGSTVITPYLQKIFQHEVIVYNHLTSLQQDAVRAADDIFEAFREHKDGYELTVIGQFYHFFGIIFGNHYYLESITRKRRDYRRVVQLKQVVDYIEKNYARQISLSDIAGAVSMSPRYFCRFFSEMTHQSPMDYLNRQRIEQACFQLAATDDSITEVAYKCGFNDLSYFIRTFRKYKGVTPGRYKKGGAVAGSIL